MLVIAGRIRVKPERREDAVRLALDVSRETVKEAGCRSYRFYADLEDPGLFFLFEEWDGPDALAQHFATSDSLTDPRSVRTRWLSLFHFFSIRSRSVRPRRKKW